VAIDVGGVTDGKLAAYAKLAPGAGVVFEQMVIANVGCGFVTGEVVQQIGGDVKRAGPLFAVVVIPGQPQSETTAQGAVTLAVDGAHVILEIVKVDVLVGQLRLRLDLPVAVAKAPRPAHFRGYADAVTVLGYVALVLSYSFCSQDRLPSRLKQVPLL